MVDLPSYKMGGFPVVMIVHYWKIAIEMVDLPSKNGDVPSFLYVYWRVSYRFSGFYHGYPLVN